jgi:hypothetical protein
MVTGGLLIAFSFLHLWRPRVVSDINDRKSRDEIQTVGYDRAVNMNHGCFMKQTRATIGLSYDRMASFLASYGSEEALKVARELDVKVESPLLAAVAAVMCNPN